MAATVQQQMGWRILAVDDSPEMRLLVTLSLEPLGHSVLAVDCGAAALAAAGCEAFDLVILDVDMPGMDGCAVGRALRQDPRNRAALIAMHTSLDESTVRDTFDGYDAFLPKPCHPAQLGEQVRGLAQHSRRERRVTAHH